jgi:hypothetical protein
MSQCSWKLPLTVTRKLEVPSQCAASGVRVWMPQWHWQGRISSLRLPLCRSA